MRPAALVALACALQVPAVAAPDHDKPATLTGTYSIGATSLTDPAPEDKKDALLRLYLTGKAARDLFAALNVKPVKDQCLIISLMQGTDRGQSDYRLSLLFAYSAQSQNHKPP